MAARTVYVELLDEVVEVWRPVVAEAETDEIVRLPGAAPSDEHWAFGPVSRVRCEWRDLGEGLVLVAIGLAP